MKYVCQVCGYVYDPAENDGIPFEQLPDDWVCPTCGVGKSDFAPPKGRPSASLFCCPHPLSERPLRVRPETL